jgi:hypothetical protein
MPTKLEDTSPMPFVRNEKLLSSQDDFNPFTEAIVEACKKNGEVLCIMRNDRNVNVCFKPDEEEEGGEAMLRTEDFSMIWNNDGSSITSEKFDLIEFRP